MNANDEGGIIMGNWGRDFSGGVEPWSWTGSTEILQQYMRTKKSVKYGQCWVFCGVATTSENSSNLICAYNRGHQPLRPA